MKKLMLIAIASLSFQVAQASVPSSENHSGLITLANITAAVAQLEVTRLPQETVLRFTRDYKVDQNEDVELTHLCHMEPTLPAGGDITPAGTLLVVKEIQEFEDEGEPVVAIAGDALTGDRYFMIHCEHGRETIGNLMKGLWKKHGIEVLIPAAALKAQ